MKTKCKYLEIKPDPGILMTFSVYDPMNLVGSYLEHSRFCIHKEPAAYLRYLLTDAMIGFN